MKPRFKFEILDSIELRSPEPERTRCAVHEAPAPSEVRLSDSRFQQTNSRSAFTLIELMLALAVMAIVLLAINAVFFAAMRLRERATDSVNEALPVEQTLDIMRRDLEGAMPPTTNGIFSGDFKVGNVTSLGISQPVEIELYTSDAPLRENLPWGDVQRVTYELQPTGDRSTPGRNLIRSVTRNLLATTTPPPDDQLLMSGVQSIGFYCYDGTQWRNYWDTTMGDTNLPTAVRVQIQLAPPGGSTASGQLVQMVVPIDMQTTTNQELAGSSSGG